MVGTCGSHIPRTLISDLNTTYPFFSYPKDAIGLTDKAAQRENASLVFQGLAFGAGFMDTPHGNLHILIDRNLRPKTGTTYRDQLS
ncbi:hypothetical protein N7509_001392 [Penicillium cosmopolitanum]|uniref:Uncharacterized protein n=1 Tax=Penicillium cosmopolitanum TaxID=1131564 RepID=A0A9W9WC58_9EURO|nr:uncharacterized protein N7509_001392 [Penicillium cosmopolitanum]KAJ5414765.1 hypothetical protein N7509_001392 [Penicillium cosmopolitanum]